MPHTEPLHTLSLPEYGITGYAGYRFKKQCLWKNNLYLLEELLSSSGIRSAVVHKYI